MWQWQLLTYCSCAIITSQSRGAHAHPQTLNAQIRFDTHTILPYLEIYLFPGPHQVKFMSRLAFYSISALKIKLCLMKRFGFNLLYNICFQPPRVTNFKQCIRWLRLLIDNNKIHLKRTRIVCGVWNNPKFQGGGGQVVLPRKNVGPDLHFIRCQLWWMKRFWLNLLYSICFKLPYSYSFK